MTVAVTATNVNWKRVALRNYFDDEVNELIQIVDDVHLSLAARLKTHLAKVHRRRT